MIEIGAKGFGYIILLLVFSLPIAITVTNIICLIKTGPYKIIKIISWSCTVVFGILFSIIYALLMDIVPLALWDEQLYNNEKHQPFWTEAAPVYLAIVLLAIAGFILLTVLPLRRTPPLLLVLAMAAQYPFLAACFIWCVQVCNSPENMLLGLFPVNLIIIMLTMFRQKILEWRKLEGTGQGKGKVVTGLRRILHNSGTWPLMAFIAALPMLGIILGIAVLFGQSPDILIKAWTETAEWNLSGQTAPPQLYYDEHYLCTVAAGGHEKVVKPLRMGERHGHRVVVNRQLEIANAFEQVLEERTPSLHRFIRHIYDQYGFPVARKIKTKTACDLVYLIMKPLEWFFLCVIYLNDARPEDRIAVQYMPGYRNFQKKMREKV